VLDIILVVGLFRLQISYLPVVVAAIVLNGANILGYWKCSSNAKTKMQNMVENGLKQGSMSVLENNSIRNWVLSALLNTTNSKATSTESV